MGPFLPYYVTLMFLASRCMKECGTVLLCFVSLPSVKTWMEGTYDIPSYQKKKISISLTTELNWMGFLAKMQIISYSSIIWNHVHINMFQRCSIENQKGTIAKVSVQQLCPSGSQLVITSYAYCNKSSSV